MGLPVGQIRKTVELVDLLYFSLRPVQLFIVILVMEMMIVMLLIPNLSFVYLKG